MTQPPTLKSVQPIRLVFTLERAEHPKLYDELIGFHKGIKRVNRLRVLAYDGLLMQQGVYFEMVNGGGRQVRPEPPIDKGVNVTNDLFGPSIDD